MTATRKIRVIVYHGSYGCDTGCCGHYVELPDHPSVGDNWTFAHPYRREDFETWANEYAQSVITEQFGADHVADIDWVHSTITDA